MDQFGYPGWGMPPRRGILKVHGMEGINALRMAPNDEAIALDETDNIMWMIRTDSAGYKTPTPFTIAPYQPEPPVDLRDLSARLKRMEDAFYAEHRTANAGAAAQPGTNPAEVPAP
jgi:hypothetical protein